MRVYLLNDTDIYTHLATEHWFLHHSTVDIVLLWQSHNAVVCGKHQNIAAEVNIPFAVANEIHIARRLTGGGTVFHDRGNICFSIIKNHEGAVERTVDYKRFLDPIKQFLNEIGVPASYSARHDLMIDDRKISGNAQHVFLKNKRVLHHGTLLFNSDLKKLGTAIKPLDGISHRGVNSVRSTVCNIQEFCPQFKQPLELMQALQMHYVKMGFFAAELDAMQYDYIYQYRNEKYCKQEWIYDYSPKHEVKRNFTYENETYTLQAKIEKGQIMEVEIGEDDGKWQNLVMSLQGTWRLERVQAVFKHSVLHKVANEMALLLF